MSETEDDQENLRKYAQAESCAWCKLSGITALLLVAALAPIITLATGWQPGSIEPPDAFARSGAITSVFALVAGVALTKYRADFQGRGIADLFRQQAFNRYLCWYESLSSASTLLAVVGSVVWAYGDLPLR